MSCLYLKNCLSLKSFSEAEPTFHYKSWNTRHYLSQHPLQVVMDTGSRIHQSEAAILEFESGAGDTSFDPEALGRGGSSCSKIVFPWQQRLHAFPSLYLEQTWCCFSEGVRHLARAVAMASSAAHPVAWLQVVCVPCHCGSRPGFPGPLSTLQAIRCYFNKRG